MSAWVFLLLGGMDSIVFGPIRWCVWSFRPSSPLRLPHLKFLFVCLSSLSKAGTQLGSSCDVWLEQQGVQKNSCFVNCQQQADMYVQSRAEFKAIVMHKYSYAAQLRFSAMQAHGCVSTGCPRMPSVFVVCMLFVFVVCSLWMLYIIEHL